MADFLNKTSRDIAGLFPLIIKEHEQSWLDFYNAEKERLSAIFGNTLKRISHIGSTAVCGLAAKPTVDILVEIDGMSLLPQITKKLTDDGYVVNTPACDIIMYLRGYTPEGFCGQAAHIHVRPYGDYGELYFRDILRDSADIAFRYQQLKLELQKRFTHDRDGYTGAKSQFIKRYTDMAREHYANRYKPESETNIIVTTRLVLRPFETRDCDEIYKLSRENGMRKWMPDQVYDSREQAAEVLEYLTGMYREGCLPFVLATELKNGPLIGHAGLSEIKSAFEIGYATGERYQNTGYAGEAVAAFAKWGKKRFGIDVLLGLVKENNFASSRVLQKAGFIYSHTDQSHYYDKNCPRRVFVL